MDGHPRPGFGSSGTELGLQAASLAYHRPATPPRSGLARERRMSPTRRRRLGARPIARGTDVIDYETFKLMHQHADGWHEMQSRPVLDSASDDIERQVLKHGLTFRCSACDQEVVIAPPDEDRR
jgi:hypothetical protein